MALQDARQLESRDAGQHLFRRGGRPVHVSDDGYATLAVDATDVRVAVAELGVGDRRKRHLGAIGSADAKVLEIADGASLGLRVAHHDLDLFTTPLNALDLGTIKRLAPPGGLGRPGSAREPRPKAGW